MILPNTMKKYNKDIVQLAYTFGGKIIAMICFFALDIIIARNLGFEFYNEWNYAFAYITIGNWIARFGIDAATKSFVATSKNRKKEYIIAGIEMQFVTGLCIEIFFVMCSFIISSYFISYPHLRNILIIGSIYSILYGMFSTIKESFVGLIDFKRSFLMTTLEFSGYLIFGLIGVHYLGIYGLSAAYVLALFIPLLYGVKVIKPNFRTIKKRKTERKDIFKYALYLAIANIGGIVLTEMDSIMLGIFSSNEVGIYAVSKNLISKATNVSTALCVGLMPKFADINIENYEQKKDSYVRTLRMTTLISVVLSMIIGIFGKKYIAIFYGEEYRDSYSILLILLWYFIIYGITTFEATLLQYHKKGKEILFSYVILIGFNLVLNLLLVPSFGANGAAFATSFSIVPYCIMLSLANRKIFVEVKKS